MAEFIETTRPTAVPEPVEGQFAVVEPVETTGLGELMSFQQTQ